MSVESGRVHVEWELGSAATGSTIDIVWREIGGPTVTIPSRRGFGSLLIERGVALEFDGTSQLAFQPEGLICKLQLPLSHKLGLAT